MRNLLILFIFLSSLILRFEINAQSQGKSSIISRTAKETITPIELNHGDILRFTSTNGQVLTLELRSTSANILYTNRDKIPPGESGNDRGNMWRARLMYEFSCDALINGQPMTMRRYVCSQESFYEPYVINGVRIWFDGVDKIFEQNGGFLNTARSANGKPNKNGRFLLQDMDRRVCPGEIYAWFKDGEERNPNFIYNPNFIDIGRCFNGDDCYLGAYLGGESHGALDIDMEMNSLMYAPFDLDDQKTIRVEGTKTWTDGSKWLINTGHVIETYIPENTPIKGGTVYGKGARRAAWWHPHAHFGIQIEESGVLYDVDPWIIFWQHFEDNKMRDRSLRALMEPVEAARTGSPVTFKALCKLKPDDCRYVQYYWTFGEGGSASGPITVYNFTKPGIYPVTVYMDSGGELSSFTQHITVSGNTLTKPSHILAANDEPSFRKRPLDMTDVYSMPVKMKPNTLEFLARPSRPVPKSRIVQVRNNGGGVLDSLFCGINYLKSKDWLAITLQGDGNNQELAFTVNGSRLPGGRYEAEVSVHCRNSLNSPQKLSIIMEIPISPASSVGVTIDDKDSDFYCTPFFWIGHRFHGWGWPELKEAEGYNHFYLINGQRDKAGEYARFNPDLEEGLYDIWLYEKTPYASGPPANNEPARFQVKVVHAEGESLVWMNPEPTKGFYPRPYRDQHHWRWLEPQPSRLIGSFKFEEGKDGYVEILAEGSTGQVIVDAVRFLKKAY